MMKKFNLFINVFAITTALIEIALSIAGAIPTQTCFGISWFCVISWVVIAWIYKHRLEKKENEINEIEDRLEDAMKKLEF